MPILLRPSAPTAPAAILCGDPGRALAIAQHVLLQPRMSNHNHGLWGYHGHSRAGTEITVQATGIGGPSAVRVLAELADLGVRRAIRVGTATAQGPEPPLGAGVAVVRALAHDGTSAALGWAPGAAIAPDARLLAALLAAVPRGATVVSRDLSGALAPPPTEPANPAEVADQQTAGILAASARLAVAAAAVLVVASSDEHRLEDEPLEAALLRLASAAAEALSGVTEP